MTRIAHLSKKFAVALLAVMVALALLPPIRPAEAQVAGSVSGVAWVDSDGDGVRGSGEVGLGGVAVSLYRFEESVVLVDSAVTAGDGGYLFGGLDVVCFESSTSCRYQVYFDNPDAGTYVFSPRNVGADDSVDSDVRKRWWGDLASAELKISQTRPNNTTTDAGFVPPVSEPAGSVGGVAWVDSDGDGVRGSGEVGLGGVAVSLYRFEESVVLVDSAVTAGDGGYLFGGLDVVCFESSTSCRYQVYFDNPDAGTYVFSPRNVGADDSVDSDVRKRWWGDLASAELKISQTRPEPPRV